MRIMSTPSGGTDVALYSLHLALDGAFKAAMKLSSGNRIHAASVDPVGLIISENLRSRIAMLQQESRNISQIISKYEIVSASVLGLREQLTELRSLTVSAANTSVNSTEAQQAYVAEALAIVKSYNNAIETSKYGFVLALDGSAGSLADISLLPAIDLETSEGAQSALGYIDNAAHELDGILVSLGAKQRQELECSQRAREVELQNLTAAESQLRDTDYATEYSRYVANMIRTYTSIAALSHSMLTARTVLALVR